MVRFFLWPLCYLSYHSERKTDCTVWKSMYWYFVEATSTYGKQWSALGFFGMWAWYDFSQSKRERPESVICLTRCFWFCGGYLLAHKQEGNKMVTSFYQVFPPYYNGITILYHAATIPLTGCGFSFSEMHRIMIWWRPYHWKPMIWKPFFFLSAPLYAMH